MTRRRHTSRVTPPRNGPLQLKVPHLCTACGDTATLVLGRLDPCAEHGIHELQFDCPFCGAVQHTDDLERYYDEHGRLRAP